MTDSHLRKAPTPGPSNAKDSTAPWTGQHELFIAFETISGLPSFVGLGKPHVEAQIARDREQRTDPVHGYPWEYNIAGPFELKSNRIRDALVRLVHFIRHDQCDTPEMRGPAIDGVPCWCCHDYLGEANVSARLSGLTEEDFNVE